MDDTANESVAVFDLDPQTAVAGRVGCIGALRDDALEGHRAGLLMKRPAMADLVIAILERRGDIRQQTGERRGDIRQQTGEPRLSLNQWPCADIFAVEVQKIEQEEHQRRGVAAVGYRAWIMLNEVTPSGRTPHSSPSR